jgi:hypothetical protein
MTPGLLDYLPKVLTVIGETGVTFDEALEIVHAAHEYRDPPAEPVTIGNVIYVDFRRRGLSDAVA